MIRFLTIFFLASLLLSCNFKKADFSIRTPKDWIVKDSVSDTRGRSVKMHPPINSLVPVFVENIRISIIHSNAPDRYVDALASSLKDDCYFFKELERGRSRINQYDAAWLRNYFQKDKNALAVEQKTYFIIDGGIIYMIVCTAKMNELDQFQPKIDDVLSTFEIL